MFLRSLAAENDPSTGALLLRAATSLEVFGSALGAVQLSSSLEEARDHARVALAGPSGRSIEPAGGNLSETAAEPEAADDDAPSQFRYQKNEGPYGEYLVRRVGEWEPIGSVRNRETELSGVETVYWIAERVNGYRLANPAHHLGFWPTRASASEALDLADRDLIEGSFR